MTENKIDLPKFGRTAEVRADSFNEAENTVEIIWTTGAPVRRYSWYDDVYYSEILEVTESALRLDRLNAGAPLLNTHDSSELASVIGAVVPGSVRIENGIGYATVRLSRTEEDAGIVQKIKDKIIVNISVGYRIHKVVKTAGEEGEDEDWRVVDWEPLELSAVPIPADPGAQVRGEKQGEKSSCVFETSSAPRTKNNKAVRSKMTLKLKQQLN